MELEKLQIIGYTDAEFSAQESGRQFEVQINPASLKIKKDVRYDTDNTPGEEKKAAKYKYHQPASLSFDIILDDTGVVFANMPITAMIQLLEKTLYKINAESHEPGYAKVAWGSTIFHGRVSSLSYDYTLFAPNGTPLRVKIALSFTEHSANDTAIKNSPDISRVKIFKAGTQALFFATKYMVMLRTFMMWQNSITCKFSGIYNREQK
jgi:hypothetical protein